MHCNTQLKSVYCVSRVTCHHEPGPPISCQGQRARSRLVSPTRPSHSQERVWYVTVQLIVLADSGCRVYTRSHSTQTTYTFLQKSWGLEQTVACKVPDPFLRKGVARDTRSRRLSTLASCPLENVTLPTTQPISGFKGQSK